MVPVRISKQVTIKILFFMLSCRECSPDEFGFTDYNKGVSLFTNNDASLIYPVSTRSAYLTYFVKKGCISRCCYFST